MRSLALICATIYISGVILYSSLFIFSANQDPMLQAVKVLVAGTHSLVLIVPVALAQSRHITLKGLGFGLVTAYFLYAIFLVGFFPYFGFVPEIYAFDSSSLRDLSEVSNHYFKQISGWRELVLIALFVMLVGQIRSTPIPTYGVMVVAAPLLLVATSFQYLGGLADSKNYGNVTVLRRFGPVVFSYASLSEWMSSDGAYLAVETPFPGKVADLIWDTDASTQAFVSRIPKVSRITIVQIESFDPIAIESYLSQIPVMPFVSGLRDSCLNYQNFFTMKGAGGSSDAEFSFATGLVPSARLPSLKHFDFAGVETLYEQLQANGITSSFSHNNHSGFYGRNQAYAQLPSVETQFIEPLQRDTEIAFARQTLASALRSSEKSLHYFFNFASHGPYQGYSTTTEEKFSIRRADNTEDDYLATMSEVDQMIAELFKLQEVGFTNGENIFILTADHPSQLHVTEDELSPYRIPMMICHHDFDGSEITNPFGSIDVYTTILEAYGLNGGKQNLGQSMFWDAPNAVLLPQRKIIYRNSSGTLELTPCDENCNAYFNYTEQYIRF